MNQYYTTKLQEHFGDLVTNKLGDKAARANKITIDPSPINKFDSVSALPYSITHINGLVMARTPISYEELFDYKLDIWQISTRFMSDPTFRKSRLEEKGILMIPSVAHLNIRNWGLE